jgi:uncharacterized protein YceH (UPF0502 family)
MTLPTTDTLTPPAPITLTPVEARVLATLMEKARTVPDSYPLSLNTLMLGCNQKSSREPLMNLTEAEIATALDTLMPLNLVRASSGSRVARYEHNFQRGVGLLILRGPQTAGELRLNAERWYRFADISSVEGFLEELQDRSDAKGGPLTVKLPRAPGAREQRWAHLLCGPVDLEAAAAGTPATGGATVAGLTERVTHLEGELAQLQQTVRALCAELGVSQPGQN